MLSVENPPPDSPNPSEISLLQVSDEIDPSDNNNKFALQEHVDPLESGHDDDNKNRLLPTFSIRDYVFNARNKDISRNWPFSQKNFQLCLKHGVADLLPPFQPPDSVKTQATLCGRLCAAENSNCDGEFTTGRPRDDHIACVNVTNSSSSSEFEGENKLPLFALATTSPQLHSEICTDSVPIYKSHCLELENDTSQLEESAAAAKRHEAAQVFLESLPNQRTQATVQHPVVKKCRLIVKLSNTADHPSLNELDTMASNVCPVCKTFSSSSNTTLNAHIDQCLSGGSAIYWAANSNKIKHRIKPKKTKSMVDIYATAQHCTLEMLDRRNGTSWATNNSCLPAQGIGACAEDKEQIISSANPESVNNQDAVYIDANGTKLRILSRFDDVPSVSKIIEDCGPRQLSKGAKGSEFISVKKRKSHMQKHHKFQKLSSQAKRYCSSKPRLSYEDPSCRKGNFFIRGNHPKDKQQYVKSEVHIQLNGDGTIRRRRSAYSKEAGIKKKTSETDGHQFPSNNVGHNLPTDSAQSSLGDSHVERSYAPEDPITYSGERKRTKFMSYEPLVYECSKQTPLRKGVGLLSFGSQGGRKEETSPVLPNKKTRLMKCGAFVLDGHNDPQKYNERYLSAPNKQRMDMKVGQNKSSDGSGTRLMKARRLSLLRKNFLTVSGASPESKFNLKRKFPALRNSQVHCMSESGRRAVGWATEGHDSKEIPMESQSMTEEITDKMSVDGSHVLKIRKEGALSIVRKEEALARMNMLSATQNYGHGVGANIDSSFRGDYTLINTIDDAEPSRKERETDVDNFIKHASEIASGSSVTGLTKSLELHKVANILDAKLGLLHLTGAYEGRLSENEAPTCSSQPFLGSGQVMFCADDTGNGMIVQSADTGADESNGAQENHFLEVDPIPIPGPPGSFLPSPGGTSSEDNQGNSSLNSSRVQSYEDRLDLDERDSLDSPVSSISIISNSPMARSILGSSGKLSVGSHAVQDEILSGHADAIVDGIVGSSVQVLHCSNIEAERINILESKMNITFSGKETCSLRNDQPCCCFQKEGASQGNSLNYLDPQVLMRQAVNSVPHPVDGEQMSCDPNKRSCSLNSKAEVFSLSNYRPSGPEKAVLPATNSLDFPNRSPNSKVLIHGDDYSVSPSFSSLVLRLMGKDLMVVNKEEDASSQPRQAQPGSVNDQALAQLGAVSGIARCGDCLPFYHVAQGPLVFGHNQTNRSLQGSDCRFRGFRSHVSFETPQTSASDASSASLVAPAAMPYDKYKGGCSLPISESWPKNRLNAPLTCSMEKMVANPPGNPVREIIIIEDSPESKANSAVRATFREGITRNQVSLFGVSVPMECKPRDVNPCYGYPCPW